MDHLLARLSVEESPKIRQLIVELIFDSFCPPNIDEENPRDTFKLERIVFLIESNLDAARSFFLLMNHFAPKLEYSVEGVILMLRCVWSCVKKSKIDEQENDQQSSKDISTKNDVENQNIDSQNGELLTTDENDSSAQREQLTVENHAVICGLLECSVILWRTLVAKLVLEENLEIYKRLIKIASKIIQECFSFFMDERILNTFLDMACLLKPSSVQYLSASTFKKLKILEDVDVAETICSWLDGYGDLERTSNASRISTLRKRSKRIKFDSVSKNSNSSAKPRLALKYLEFLTTNIECRPYILKEHRNSLLQIRQKLRDFLEQRDVLNLDKSNDKIGSDEILLAERLLASIYFLLTSNHDKIKNCEKSNLVEECIVFLQSKLDFIIKHILPALDENNENRTALQYLSQILLNFRHALILNIGDTDFVLNLCKLLAKALEIPSRNITLFGEICQSLFNVVDFLANIEKPNKTSIDPLINEQVWPLIDRCCQKLILNLQEGTNFFHENKHDLKIITEALVESSTLVERILMINQCDNGISLLAQANQMQIQNLLLENKNKGLKVVIAENNGDDEKCMETN
uniref:Uncharacterized protein n=1 Tax=Romanomermis culicivorax TaxID=13658 RepID=A0A915JPI3_ROMCU